MPTPKRPARKRSLILAGGGIKVAFQAGVLQVWLDETDVTFDHADGASGGTLNLAMLCQGMSGTQIADNWRSTAPLVGFSLPPNVRELGRLQYAESILDLDGYRKNVFPAWGLDWDKIRASDREATFNIYNFSRQQLEVLTPDQMSEDLLCGCVTLPMWFPPVRADGDFYIDAVYVTDGNLEEAVERGADEIWVVWTVSENGEWQPGFVATYFQIIEATANGKFRQMVRRIEKNNAAVAAGQTSEFGRHIELKILRAEVPVHYILDISADRLHEVVNRGVDAARQWCAAEGVGLAEPIPRPRPTAESPVTLAFTEDMRGHVGLGASDPVKGAEKGRANHTPLAIHVTITAHDVDRFVTDPWHTASVTGHVTCDDFGGTRPISDGTFNLLVDDGDPTRKEMRYRLHFEDGQGKPLTLVGVKTVDSGNPLRVWSETTTLYTRVMRGRVAAGKEDRAKLAAAGVIRLTVPDFLRELTTFRVTGSSAVARARDLARFGRLFVGKLWDVYGRPVLEYGPI
ncbi:patatin-like phospholipase family protein [Saccharopolyspora sp. NPDC002376]